MHSLIRWYILNIFLLAPHAISSDTCSFLPKTELEEVYCKIEASKFKAKLVNIREFRNNPAKTQKLLLRPLAKKLRITMPSPQKRKAPRKAPRINTNATSTEPTPPVLSQLAHCTINQRKIICPNSPYTLQENKPTSELVKGALADNNKLLFSGKHSARQNPLAYLSKAYSVYIDKMLKIGLGGSTMSYTKFVSIYKDQAKINGNFAVRFKKMYELLKKDKKSIADSGRKINEFPKGLKSCFPLSQTTIVCDNVARNWVYTSDVN